MTSTSSTTAPCGSRLGTTSTSVSAGAKSAVTMASASCRCIGSLGSYSRCHSDFGAQVHGHGLVTRPVLGAVQMRVHGFFWTVYEMACFFPVNMQHKFQQYVEMTVVCFAFSSSTELDIAVMSQ